ncbi:MAG: hypothetical protein JST00_03185 [Deltaproteobacteria bacterium]|nr:hypothetical protein [Deltaproteobacteria bacterium]
MNDPPRGVRASVATAQPGRLALFALGLLLPAVIIFLAGRNMEGGGGIGPLAGFYFLGAAAFIAIVTKSIRRAARASARPADSTLSVEGGSLVVARDGRGRPRRMARDRFRSGVLVPSARGAGGRLELKGDLGAGLEAWVRDLEQGRALLRDLGLSAASRPHVFSFFFGLRITVGVDGIVVAWPLLRRRRFVPYARIRDVRSTSDTVVFELVDGKTYEVETSTAKGGIASDEHLALLERIADARDAYAKAERAESLGLLARAGRPTSAWVRELKALSEASGAEYRSASLPTEALVRIAVDPKESEEMRMGAALALRGSPDTAARAQLREAAEASASPRVRVALSVASEELDDDEVAREMDDPESRYQEAQRRR